MIEDAGGEYFIRREERIGDYGQNMGFETVFRRYLDMDVWLEAPVGLKSIDDLLARDSRVSLFRALQKGEVYTMIGVPVVLWIIFRRKQMRALEL